MSRIKDTSTREMCEHIYDSILAEPHLSKEIIVPKIYALIKGFRMRMQSENYSKIESPSQLAKHIRANTIKEAQLKFWRREMKKLVGEEKMKEYYELHDKELENIKATHP